MAVETHHDGDIIEREELTRRLRDRSLTIVDVLPEQSWIEGHIPRALNLPLADIDSRAQQVLPNLEADLALYCAKFT